MHTESHKSQSQRQLRVGEELKHVLADIFMRGDLYHPETRATLTALISEVRISPDLHNATVFITPVTSSMTNDELIKGLTILGPKIRHGVAGRVRMRHLPALLFKIDKSFEEAGKIEEIFSRPEVKRDLGGTEEEIG